MEPKDAAVLLKVAREFKEVEKRLKRLVAELLPPGTPVAYRGAAATTTYANYGTNFVGVIPNGRTEPPFCVGIEYIAKQFLKPA